MQSTADTVQTIIEIVSSLGVLIGAGSYFYFKTQQGKVKASEDTNKQLQDANEKLAKTLNELLSTQDKKITDLQNLHQQSLQEIALLKGRVEELSKKNGDLQEIINRALDRFFEKHPEEAMKLATVK